MGAGGPGSGRKKGSKNKKKSGSKTAKKSGSKTAKVRKYVKYVRKPYGQLTPYGQCRRLYPKKSQSYVSRRYCKRDKICYAVPLTSETRPSAKTCARPRRPRASGILLGGRRRAGVLAGVDAGVMLGGYYPM